MSVRLPPTIVKAAAAHSDLNDGRCIGLTRAGVRCRSVAMKDSRYCAIHAPAIEPTADPTETPRYTNLPPGLESRYQTGLQDRYLLHLRDEISILDARVHDLLGQSKEGVNAATWKKARTQWGTLKRAVRDNDSRALSAIMDAIDDTLEEGKRDSDLWLDIERLMEQRRRLVETEQKYLHQTNQMISTEVAMLLLAGTITALKNSVRKYVSTIEVVDQIVADAQVEYERIVGA